MKDTKSDRADRIRELEEKGDRASLREARELKYREMTRALVGPRDATTGEPKEEKE